MSIDGRKGMDLQILIGVKCVDEVALQTMPHQHPRRKYSQAMAARTGEWSTGSSTESQEAEIKERAQIEHYLKQSGQEAQGGQGLGVRKKCGEWTLRMRSRGRKKLDEQRTKLQKELREH